MFEYLNYLFGIGYKTVSMVLQTAINLQKDGIRINRPKMLGCFGTSYLYSIFTRIGVTSDVK